MNKKIFIILPHKDQFIKNYAGSASIWVKDFFKKSIFKKNINIFGSTKNTKNIFPKIISYNMLCIHRSVKIKLNEIWKKFEITDSNYHPHKKIT